MVQDQVDLLRQLLVELGDDRLNRLDDVAADQLRLRERLLGQRAHGALDGFFRLVGLRLEFLLQQESNSLASSVPAVDCASCWILGQP